ncbi:alpha/beta hydrolase [Zoogloea sp.]|uniref:RBBP9/YdeN family alpha/beta hydrolase n=1 Tax=Zoogloea sp. TaxID=49181 RepID=UPI001AD05B8F|nr:alpha/beta hydrolase [Zoogloea sp.]MBN8281994.1 alpha/beta hydrolase [Zoogloea sp.]
MQHTTLIVPGFHGSGPAHWQSWFEAQVPGTRRVSGIDWEQPVLPHWAQAVRDGIDHAPGPVWLVAHSFGCLAAVLAASSRPEQVAGLLLVAPADPERFTPQGLRGARTAPEQPSLARWIPRSPLGAPSLVVASTNDPWVRLSSAAYWAQCWGSQLVNIGAAGHINVDSGHGPWPRGLAPGPGALQGAAGCAGRPAPWHHHLPLPAQ